MRRPCSGADGARDVLAGMSDTTIRAREHAAAILPAAYLSTSALRDRGLSERQIGRLVQSDRLLRVRRGRYVDPRLHEDLVSAATLGARLDCVSLLAAIGVFVRERGHLHVQLEMGTSRVPPRGSHVVAHWRRSSQSVCHLAADLIEALAQACRCQSPRDSIATLDSAWHHGLVDEAGIAAVFALLPRRFQGLRPLVDARAESGPETLVRLMLRMLGCQVEVQVFIDGVGRVDLLVDGWLIIECDSRAHHSSWEERKRDMRRDLAAAARGYSTIRPLAEDILAVPDQTQALLKRAVSHRPCG